jgi:uncharacterized repeat protein (TIGR02543 family)
MPMTAKAADETKFIQVSTSEQLKGDSTYIIAVEGTDGQLYALDKTNLSSDKYNDAVATKPITLTNGEYTTSDEDIQFFSLEDSKSNVFLSLKEFSETSASVDLLYLGSNGFKTKGQWTGTASSPYTGSPRRFTYSNGLLSCTEPNSTSSPKYFTLNSENKFIVSSSSSSASQIVLLKADKPPVVKFDMNGKDNATNKPAAQTVAKGSTATRPSPDPSVDGFTFGGWYQEAACTNEYNFSTPVNSDTTIYAKWDENPPGPIEDPATIKVTPITKFTTGDTYVIATKYKDYYYALSNVATKKSNNNSTTDPQYSIGLAERVEPTVDNDVINALTFEKNAFDNLKWSCYSATSDTAASIRSGSNQMYITSPGSGGVKYQSGRDVNYTDNRLVGKSGTKRYYVKFGDADAQYGIRFTTVQNDSAIDGSEIYIFKIEPYTVSFEMNNHGESVASQSINYGEKATRPTTNPTDDNYDFDDWYADSACKTKFNFDSPITQDTKIYANWTEKTPETKYSVRYEKGGTDVTGDAPTDSDTYVLDTTVNVKGQGTLAKTGYTFAGWKKANDDTIYKVGTDHSSFQIKSDTIFTAQWTPNNYTVKFVSGEANDTTHQMDDQTFTYDTEQNLNENKFTYANHVFAG